jgi:ABC-2 type transport system permease protein
MLQKIAALMWKDTIIRFSSWSELLFFLVLPIVFIVLLSGGVAGFSGDSDNRIPLLVVDEDGSDMAADLVALLAASDTVRVVEESRATAEERFADEEAAALLLIPAGFGEAILAGETAVLDLRQLPNNNNATAADQAVQTAVGQISRPLLVASFSLAEAERLAPFTNDADRESYFQQAIGQGATMLAAAPSRTTVTQPVTAPEDANSFDMAAHQTAGQLITWVFIPALGTSAFLAFERRYGTLRRLMVTPTNSATYLTGVVSGQYVAALVQMALLVGFGWVVMNVNWGNSPVALAMLLAAFGLCGVAFGMMLGTFVKSEGQANNLSIMLGMTMALLGGCWFPIELFPPAVQTAVHVLPTTWAMQGLSDLALRGLGIEAVLLETAVLLAFTLAFFVVGVRRFRYE